MAIDRSRKMIAMARRRNAGHVAAGRASLQAASLHEADFRGARFDSVLAVHVGVFSIVGVVASPAGNRRRRVE